MIYDGLVVVVELGELLHKVNPSSVVDLETCITIAVENAYALGHFKEQAQTQLQYARNLANTVYESIKRSVSWSAYYFTHPSSNYPIPNSLVGFRSATCQLSHTFF